MSSVLGDCLRKIAANWMIGHMSEHKEANETENKKALNDISIHRLV